MKNWLVFSLFLMVANAEATETLWLKLTTSLNYSTDDSACKSSGVNGNHFYFTATVENGKISKAIFQNHPRVFPYIPIHRSISFPRALAEAIELFQDNQKRYWLKTLPLNSALIKWVLYYPGERAFYCRVPEKVAEVAPESFTFHFDTQDLNDGILVSHAKSQNFSGTTASLTSFQAKVKLTERAVNQFELLSFPMMPHDSSW